MSLLMPEVTVNGVTIPSAVIAAEAQNHPAPKGKPGLAWRAAARALVLRELILQEARARGLEPEPTEVAPGQLETPEEALIRQVLDQDVSAAPVDEAALRAIYDEAPERFRAPPLWEAAHILYAADPSDAGARAVARAAAQAAIETLARAPKRFDDLAQSDSACSSRAAGGRLGQIGPGDTVAEFEAALRALAEGEIAPEPFETRFGFHVIRLDAVATGAVLPFDAVLPRLRAAAEKAAWVHASRAYAERLLHNARIEGLTLDAA